MLGLISTPIENKLNNHDKWNGILSTEKKY